MCSDEKKCCKSNFTFTIRHHRDGDVVAVVDEGITGLSFTHEIDKVPTLDFNLPLSLNIEIPVRAEVEVKNDCITFCGRVVSIDCSSTEGYMKISLEHILNEWSDELIPGINLPADNIPVDALFGQVYDLGRDLWNISFLGQMPAIYYVFPIEDKLTALVDIISHTYDLHFRAKLDECRGLEIGRFGESSGLLVTTVTQLEGKAENILPLIDIEEVLTYDKYSNEFLCLGGQTNNGYSQVTLEQMFENPALQDPLFPVTIATGFVNNLEEDYTGLDDVKLGPNNQEAYLLTDLESVANANGQIYQESISMKDINSFRLYGNEITDVDRVQVALELYKASVRELKKRRSKKEYKVKVLDLCNKLNVGDKIKLVYDKQICVENQGCDQGMFSKVNTKKVNDEFYVVGISRSYNSAGCDTAVLDLSSEPFPLRDLQDELAYVTDAVSRHEYRNEKEDKQRKTTQHDLDSLESYLDITAQRPGVIFRPLSNDKVYMQEWDMKFVFEQIFTPINNLTIVIDGFNMNPALIPQYPGQWVPNSPNALNMYPDIGIGVSYDIVQAAIDLNIQDIILASGEHVIEFRTDGDARLRVYQSIQYSEVAR